jgi:integrase
MGGDPVNDKQTVLNGDTFAELAEAYIRDYAKPRKRSWKEDRRALDRDLLPRFRNRKASEIKRREVIDLLRDIKGRGAPILANRTLEIIRRIYNWGISNEFVEINPCIGIEKPSQENQRDKVLSETEIRILWGALDQEPLQIGSRYKLQLLTAQRSGEVRKMRWGDIDLVTGWWTIPEQFSKNRRSHRVPLSEMAIQILEEIATAKIDNDWVFPSPTAAGAVRSNTKANKRIRKQSGIEFQPHDLRRTAATKMAGELGVDRLTLSKILNHVETGVTAIFDRHSYDKEKRAALQDWSNYLNQILHRGQPFAVAS